MQVISVTLVTDHQLRLAATMKWEQKVNQQRLEKLRQLGLVKEWKVTDSVQ